MTSKRMQRKHRERERILSVCKPSPALCPNCLQPGPHYVPPSFGDPGMWICDAPNAPTKVADFNLYTSPMEPQA